MLLRPARLLPAGLLATLALGACTSEAPPAPAASPILLSVAGGRFPEGPYTAGQAYLGRRGYVEYLAGNAPVILAAPHGGSLRPDEIPDRTASRCGGVATVATDLETEALVRAVRERYFARFGRWPHVVVNHLARRKLDANRPLLEAACGDPEAELAYAEWHDFIDAAKAAVAAAHGRGWFIDVHGHGHARQRLELGYLLDASQLDLADAALDAAPALEDSSSVRALSRASAASFAALLRGPESLGSLYAAEGFPAVPSRDDPRPGSDPYFDGGYGTQRHGCGVLARTLGGAADGAVCGVQIETNFTGVRDDEANRRRFGDATARVLERYLAAHWGLRLADAAPAPAAQPPEAPVPRARAELTWTGAVGVLVEIHRDGAPLVTTENDGAHVDLVGRRTGAVAYRVCAIGGRSCSNEARVSF